MREKDQAIEIIGPEGVPLHFPAATLSEAYPSAGGYNGSATGKG